MSVQRMGPETRSLRTHLERTSSVFHGIGQVGACFPQSIRGLGCICWDAGYDNPDISWLEVLERGRWAQRGLSERNCARRVKKVHLFLANQKIIRIFAVYY